MLNPSSKDFFKVKDPFADPTEGRGIAPHVGLKRKTPSMRVLMKLEPQTGRLRQSGRDRSTAEKRVLYQLGLCHLRKIEEET